MLKEINHILNNWDYQVALDFYKKYGSNPHLADIFSTGETKFFNKKLKEELERIRELEICNTTPDPHIPKTHQADDIPKIHQVDEDVADTLESIRQKRNAALREQDHLRGRHVLLVEQNAAPEELKPTVKRIMELSRELFEHWYKLDYHQTHGILPPEASDPVKEVFENVSSEAELVKIRNNQRSNLSKGKKLGRSVEKMQFYQAVLDEAEKRIALA